jgi:hypothetical protein
MSEISRDKLEFNKINANNASFKGKPAEQPIAVPTPEQPAEGTSLKNHPGDMLGRSLVNINKLNSISVESAENIKNDLAFMARNKDLVNKSEKMYDIAYQEAIDNKIAEPYKEATQMQMGYVQEMNKE